MTPESVRAVEDAIHELAGQFDVSRFQLVRDIHFGVPGLEVQKVLEEVFPQYFDMDED